MPNEYSWGHDLISSDQPDPIATESLVAGPQDLPTRPGLPKYPSFFNPVNIVSENGIYYVTIYVCRLEDSSSLSQSLSIWLSSLKETDHIKLSVSAMVTNIPFGCLITTMSALANTKAKIEILLDTIVLDGLAYFYLLADEITLKDGGALFVPSYVDQRKEDTSIPWRAVHDFYQWVVEDAVINKRLTEEESHYLNAGTHVVIPQDRFKTS